MQYAWDARTAWRGLGAVLLALSVVVAAVVVVPSTADAKTFRGTNRADVITGTAKSDVIRLRGGNDVGRGKGGGDRIAGAGGKDRLLGGKGADRLLGGKRADVIKAVDGARDARINGGAGRNKCRIDDADLPVTSKCARIRAVDKDAGGGSGGGGGGGTGGGGDDEGPGERLELDSGSGLVCDDASLACTFQLSGGGADQPVGTVTGGGGITVGAGAGASATDGEWTALGGYQCTSDGFLRVTFGSETLDVPVDCV